MKTLLALLLITTPAFAGETPWADETETRREAVCESCRRPRVRSDRGQSMIGEMPTLSGRQSTMPPVTTRGRRVRVSPSGRVTVRY